MLILGYDSKADGNRALGRLGAPKRYGSCGRKRVFRTKKEAQEVADKMSKLHGVLTVPYHCNHCSKYHLTKASNIMSGVELMNGLPKVFKMENGEEHEVHFDDKGPYVNREIFCSLCGKPEPAISRISVANGKYTRPQAFIYDSSVIERITKGSKIFKHKRGKCTKEANIDDERVEEIIKEKVEVSSPEVKVKKKPAPVDPPRDFPFKADTILEIAVMLDPRKSEVSDAAKAGMAWTVLREISEWLISQKDRD